MKTRVSRPAVLRIDGRRYWYVDGVLHPLRPMVVAFAARIAVTLGAIALVTAFLALILIGLGIAVFESGGAR